MMNQQDFDHSVAAVYDAAFGRTRWDRAMDTVARALQAYGVAMASVTAQGATLRALHVGGNVNPETLVAYLRDWRARDPHLPVLCEMKAGEWFHSHRHFDERYVRASAFYQHHMIPAGGRYVTACILRDSGNAKVVLSITRGLNAGPVPEDLMPQLERLRTHLVNALDIESHLQSHRSGANAGRLLLAQWAQPVMLLDASGTVLFSNAAAEALLGDNEAVGIRSGRLGCRQQADERALAGALRMLDLDGAHGTAAARIEAIGQVASLGTAATDATPPFGLAPAGGRFVRLTGGSDPAGLFLLPLRPSETLSAFGSQPMAMVLFHRPSAQVKLEPFVLAQAFSLTPAETRVGMLLAQGLAPDEVTAELNVSMATVRSHIKSLLAKTGTNRQPDLVRVLSALADISLPRPGELRRAA